MLNLASGNHRYCDGVSRRSFLSVGSLALGGLTLPGILRAEARSGKRTQKSVIMVYLSGGISHQDTFDLKPKAAKEIRGEFNAIKTNVPGIEFCEHLPKLAKVADKLTVLRSIVGLRDEHTSWQNLTGYPMTVAQRENRPNVGGFVSKTLGSVDVLTPAAVDLFPTMKHRPYNSGGAGALGRQHDPVKAEGEQLSIMKLRYVDRPHFDTRRELLNSLNAYRTTNDNRPFGFDTVQQQAVDVLTSGKVVEAMDLEKEDPKLRERYGKGSPKHQGDGAPEWNDQLLMARRLVSAGVRCVTVAYGFWDTHGNNFGALKKRLPLFDQGISALVQDLHDRGLDKDVTVLVWGEFGRTPKINKKAGRDHWSRVSSALFAGGGMPSGQVIGSTDAIGGEAKDRPVHYQDVLATVYHNLGIDTAELVRDQFEKPIPILPSGARPIRELI